jgi:hypothetical protein
MNTHATPSTTSLLTSKRLGALMVLLFATLSIAGLPYAHDVANSGRYLVNVIRTIDPTLLQNDPVADGMLGFWSLFYVILGQGARLLGISATALPQLLTLSYWGIEFLTFAILWRLTRELTDHAWAFALLGAWAVHPKTPPLGGSPLFLPVVTHQEVALVLCLAALVLFLRERWLPGWLLTSAALFFHALFALHFAFCVAPVLVLWMIYRRQLALDWIGGLAIFAVAALTFRFFLAPGSFSAEEARIFIAAEGNMAHVSFLDASPLQWVKLVLLMALTFFCTRQFGARSAKVRFIFASALAGAVVALLISLLAISTRLPFFALLQPVRTFFWVTLFCYLILAATAASTWSTDRWLSLYLSAFFFLDIVNVDWAWAVALVALTWLWVNPAQRLTDRSARVLQVGFVGAVALGALASGVSFVRSVGRLGSPWALLPTLLLLGVVAVMYFRPNLRTPAILLTLVITLLGATVSWNRVFSERTPPAGWYTVREWIRDNTPVDAQFITTGGENFRTVAFRGAFGRDYGGLSWVDPLTYAEYEAMAEQIAQTRDNGVWNITRMAQLATEWGADYLLIEGDYAPDSDPLHVEGSYAIFAVP